MKKLLIGLLFAAALAPLFWVFATLSTAVSAVPMCDDCQEEPATHFDVSGPVEQHCEACYATDLAIWHSQYAGGK